MEFISKIGDVLLLDGDEKYQVLNQCEYEGKNYLFVISVPNDLNDAFDASKRKTAFVQEVIDQNNNYGIMIIENKELIKNLKGNLKK